MDLRLLDALEDVTLELGDIGHLSVAVLASQGLFEQLLQCLPLKPPCTQGEPTERVRSKAPSRSSTASSLSGSTKKAVLKLPTLSPDLPSCGHLFQCFLFFSDTESKS